LLRFIGAKSARNFMEALAEKEVVLEAIRTHETMEPAAGIEECFITGEELHRTVRFASREFAFPMTVFLFDDKIAIISSAEENFALIIESREYTEMQRKLFAMVWSSLQRTTIRVGVLHSLSGTMAISERPLVDAILMAIDEINRRGGILGRRIDPLVIDGASDPATFAREAEDLITKHGVSSVFGGWTSESRKEMLPVFERHDHLLWYPVQYEGLEQSKNILYTGAAPNQQVLPAVDWAAKHLGKTFFLVGSDYVFPRCANAIMQERIEELGATVSGEAYERLGGSNFKTIVRAIVREKPSVILNTINGDSNVAFFRELRSAGVTPKSIPVISFSIAEEEISRMQPASMAGDYAAWSYFQSIPSKENTVFVAGFQTKYGRHRVTSDPIETAYCSVYLFAEAVQRAGTDDVHAVREAARGITFSAPEGLMRIDPDNQHLERFARIGKIRADGQIDIVWSSDAPLKPDPYPKYKSQEQWQAFLDRLYKGWKGHWGKH
jgi:urea transport system substrate-binding protein